MNRTTPASQMLSIALPRNGFNDVHADAQSQVIEHAAAHTWALLRKKISKLVSAH